MSTKNPRFLGDSHAAILRRKVQREMYRSAPWKATGFNTEGVVEAILPVIARYVAFRSESIAAEVAESEGDGYYGAGAHDLAKRLADEFAEHFGESA